jgi:endonuclease/exonuclease/phosphatase family metal-dependent hydrolase
MRRPFLAFLAVLVLLAAACSGDDGGSADGSPRTDASGNEVTGDTVAGGSFSVLAYNVAGLPEGISGSSPEANAPIISPLLNDYDVVLLQEDFDFYTDLLRADATHEFMSEPHPGPDALNPIGRESAAVGDGLNILSRLPIGDMDRVPWQGCGDAAADCLALKGFARTTLTLDDGAEVDLYTLHMEAGGEDTQLRQDDLDELAAYIAAESEGRAVIIGGDWNLHTDEEPDATQFADFLAETGLVDVCEEVDCGDDVDVIDKVVFRSNDTVVLTPTLHTFEREAFVDGAGEPLSDHDALHVAFDWAA